MNTKLLITQSTKSYELIDSGHGRKLERFGDVIFSRPDPQALWNPLKPESVWKQSHATFIRKGKHTEWNIKASVPKKWPIEFGGFTFVVRPTSFKHTGLFPEQSVNWKFIEEKIKSRRKVGTPTKASEKEREIQVLNLFGYTGGATLAAAHAGASVTHVDGSKIAITWAKENAEASGLRDKPIRWIADDAVAYLKREIKRGKSYDAIIMDPPAFGHGPSGELFKIEEQFSELLELCRKVLSPTPLFFIISGYAAGYSPITYANALSQTVSGLGGTIECGELVIRESDTDRLLPCGIFVRWATQ